MNRTTLVAAIAAVVVGVSSYNVLSIDAKWDAKVNAAEGGQTPILNTHNLMSYMIDPAFEELKLAVENAPEKRKDWRSLTMAASNLAEMNNLFYIRSEEGITDKPEWMESVKKSHTVSNALAASIKEKSEYDVIKKNFIAVMESCNECHTKVVPDEEVSEIEGPASW